MSISGQRIAKNAGVMMASQLVTWVLAFLVAIFQPRFLGAYAMGQLSIAFSVWMIMGVLLSFGMDTHLMKQIARDQSKTPELLGTSIAIRCVLFVFGFGLVMAYVSLMRYPTEIFYLAFVLGVAVLFMIIGSALTAAINGLERVAYGSIATVASKTVHTVLTLALLFLGFNVYWIAAVNIVTNLVACIVLARLLGRHYQIRPRLDLSAASSMLRTSSPYLVTGLTLMVYQQVDKLFIAALATTEAVGWYSAAMNLFGTLMFIPVALGTVLFPTLSRSYAAGQDQMASVARRSFDMMFMLSIPIGLGVTVVARPLVLLLYGPAFAPSGDILAVLGLVLIFTYLNTILGQLLVSVERTGRWNVVMIAATVLTLPLDLVLIPWTARVFANGALGGAISFLLTELLMLSSAILLLPKGTLHMRNLRTVLLSLFAGVAMMGVSWLLLDVNLILAILAGGAVYPALVLLLRILPQQELQLLKDGIGKVVGRLRRTKQAPAPVGGNELL